MKKMFVILTAIIFTLNCLSITPVVATSVERQMDMIMFYDIDHGTSINSRPDNGWWYLNPDHPNAVTQAGWWRVTNPLLGTYDSSDPVVQKQHMYWMAALGCNGVAADLTNIRSVRDSSVQGDMLRYCGGVINAFEVLLNTISEINEFTSPKAYPVLRLNGSDYSNFALMLDDVYDLYQDNPDSWYTFNNDTRPFLEIFVDQSLLISWTTSGIPSSAQDSRFNIRYTNGYFNISTKLAQSDGQGRKRVPSNLPYWLFVENAPAAQNGYYVPFYKASSSSQPEMMMTWVSVNQVNINNWDGMLNVIDGKVPIERYTQPVASLMPKALLVNRFNYPVANLAQPQEGLSISNSSHIEPSEDLGFTVFNKVADQLYQLNSWSRTAPSAPEAALVDGNKVSLSLDDYPLEYRISNSSDLSNTEWQLLDVSSCEITLPSDINTKMGISIQTRNSFGESAVSTFYESDSEILDPGVTGVRTIDDLEAMTGTGSYKLMATIDLSGESWTAKTGFSGTFDGNASAGYKIMNLNGSCAGLFDTLGSGHHIKNLVIDNVDIVRSNSEAGALAKVASYGIIENCAVINAKVQAANWVGGLVSKNDHSTIKNCFVDASGEDQGIIADYCAAGGLVAYNEFGWIYDCYFNGVVKSMATGSNSSMLGGIVGKSLGNGSDHYVARCYTTGSIVGNASGSSYGGIVGQPFNDDGSWQMDIKDNYSFMTGITSTATSGRISGKSSLGYGRFSNNYAIDTLSATTKGLTTADGADITFQQASSILTYTNAGWDGDIWGTSETGYEYPILKALPTDVQPQYSLLDSADIIRVKTVDDLKAVTGTGHYKLAATIDLSGESWTAITGFSGIFDGNSSMGFKIMNLNGSCAGLFDTLGSGHHIKNLVIDNVDIVRSNSEAGALAKVASYGIIENCAVINAKVQAANWVGGLVSKNDHSTIKNCFVDASGEDQGIITDNVVAGGLVAYNEFGWIYDCYFNGTVKSLSAGSSSSMLGGIVGKSIGNGSEHYVTRCYATGSVVGNAGGSNYGGITGIAFNDDGSWQIDVNYNFSLLRSITSTSTSGRISGTGSSNYGRFSNNFALDSLSATNKGSTTKDGSDITLDQAKNIATYTNAGWDSDVWGTSETGYEYPILKTLPADVQPQYPILEIKIRTINDLKAMTGNGSYKLMATIDLSGESWTAITGFSGTFDGNSSAGYKIMNLNGSCEGLFDTLGSGHHIKNLVIDNVDIVRSNSEAGALAKVASYGIIENCAVINAKVQAANWVGGLVSKNDHSTIKNCFVDASGENQGIIADNCAAGGLVAYNEFGWIYDCYFNGVVKSMATGSNSNMLGGIVGKSLGNGSDHYVARCYTTGSIVGNASGSSYGGIVGQPFNDDGSWQMDIKDNYSFMTGITSTATSGRISGKSSLGYGRFSNNYAIDTLSATTKGLTTADGADITFQQASSISTYTNAGWDSDVWGTSTTGYEYPILKALPTEVQPQYSVLEIKIRTINDLKAMTGTGSYRLMATINLSGESWTAITGFSGTFDGNSSKGYKIMNLNGSCEGLFGTLGSGHHIKNLVIDNVNIVRNNNEAGALAKIASYGIIEDCAVINAKVQASTFAGGLVSKNDHSTIRRCFVDASGTGKGIISGFWAAGGLVAYNEFGWIYDCYFNGTVKSLSTGSNSSLLGGIVGKSIGNGSDHYVARCYTTGSIVGDAGGSYYGGIVGQAFNDDGSWQMDVKDNYSLMNSITLTATRGRISGKSSLGYGRFSNNYAKNTLSATSKGLTTADGADITFQQASMMSTYTNAGWSSSVWEASTTGYDYPILKALPADVQP